MPLTRRDLLTRTAQLGALSGLTGCSPPERQTARAAPARSETEVDREWTSVREQFQLDPEYIHLAGLLIAAHPAAVREAIERHRKELDRNPALYLEANNRRLQSEVRNAAARYLNARPNDLAITDSTTQGIALVYNGIQIRAGQEFLTARHDYYSTHEAIRYKAHRTGATVREIPLYRDIRTVTADEIVENIRANIRPKTRVVTATWVHSSTGLKIPLPRIANVLKEANAGRSPSDRILLCVDGVHGLGVEDMSPADLGCDFFMAGTHKWMFAPRGTGIIWGRPQSQSFVTPTIPSFTRGAGWGGSMTPGGFKPFEHLWAMAQAFEYHRQLGRDRVAEHIHTLTQQLSEGLSKMPHVTLRTPRDPTLTAGIVCFEVHGMSPRQVVQQLRNRRIVASTTPYSPSYARLTPALFNTSAEIERTLEAIASLG